MNGNVNNRAILTGDNRDIVGVGFSNGYGWNELPSENPRTGPLLPAAPLYGGADSIASFSSPAANAISITNLTGSSPVFTSVTTVDKVAIQFVNGPNLAYGVFSVAGTSGNTIFFTEALPYPVTPKGTTLVVLPNAVLDVTNAPISVLSPTLIKGYWIRAGAGALSTHSITLEADLSLSNVVFFDYDNSNPTNSRRTALFYENDTKVVVPNLIRSASGEYSSPGIVSFNMGGFLSPILTDIGGNDSHEPTGYHTGILELYSSVISSRFDPLLSSIEGELFLAYDKFIVENSVALAVDSTQIKAYESLYFQSCCSNDNAGIYMTGSSTLSDSAVLEFDGDYTYLIEAQGVDELDVRIHAVDVTVDAMFNIQGASDANIEFEDQSVVDGSILVAGGGSNVTVRARGGANVNIVGDNAIFRLTRADFNMRRSEGPLVINGVDSVLFTADRRADITIGAPDALLATGLRTIGNFTNSRLLIGQSTLDFGSSLTPVIIANGTGYKLNNTTLLDANAPPLVFSSKGSAGVFVNSPPWPIIPAIAEYTDNTPIGAVLYTFNSGHAVRTT